MSLQIHNINGQNPNLNYSDFENDFERIIGRRCYKAQCFLFNNFPVSVSTEFNIDLIVVIALKNEKGNFNIVKSIDGKPKYLYNQIIPIKFIDQYHNEEITLDDKLRIVANEKYLDYDSEISSIRYSFRNYLVKRCGFNSSELYIKPIVFLKNDREFIKDNHIVGPELNFKILYKYLKYNSQEIFISYKTWKNEMSYDDIIYDIERINNQASKDSKAGYLTKKKIDRIIKQLSNSKKIYEELNNNLIIVGGKAGTGKSSELLLLAMKCIGDSHNAMYLTYNKLLVYEIAKTVKSYVNSQLNNPQKKRPGEGTIMTLHSFFYRLSKSLGVLHILNAERIEELLLILKVRMRKIYDVFKVELLKQNITTDTLKSTIQNHSDIEIGTKEVGIDFINFTIKRQILNSKNLSKLAKIYFEYKKETLGTIDVNKTFLADYYGVLENTLMQINEPDKFYEKYDVKNKFDLLAIAIRLSDKYVEKENGQKIVTKAGFNETKNRRIGGFRRKRTLFIDEAQDCHRLEKEILINIFGSQHVVVANGGKEQLIRHVELCNWEVSQAQKLSIKKYNTRKKSFRIKSTVVNFANFVAKKYNIHLDLEPVDSEDEGELLIDFRKEIGNDDMLSLVKYLNTNGEINGCTPYESLLVLLESNTQRKEGNGKTNSQVDSAFINEYGNIENDKIKERGNWQYLQYLEKNKHLFWDGTVEDKSQLIVPGPYESRAIYYESCRGLEAWNVACFSMDKFFSIKRNEPDAEKYLIGDLFLNQDNEQRKNMYAATWILMAITRVIDTLYLQINDKDSEFGKLVSEYVKGNPKNVRILTEKSQQLTHDDDIITPSS